METFRRPVLHRMCLRMSSSNLSPFCLDEFSATVTVCSEQPSLLNVMQCNWHVVDASRHLQLWQNCLFSLLSVDFRRTRALMVWQSRACNGLYSRRFEDAMKNVRKNHIVWAELQIWSDIYITKSNGTPVWISLILTHCRLHIRDNLSVCNNK